jgi:hypothetical protein
LRFESICNWMVLDFWYSVQSGFSCVAVHLLLLDLFCANLRYKIILYVCRGIEIRQGIARLDRWNDEGLPVQFEGRQA